MNAILLSLAKGIYSMCNFILQKYFTSPPTFFQPLIDFITSARWSNICNVFFKFQNFSQLITGTADQWWIGARKLFMLPWRRNMGYMAPLFPLHSLVRITDHGRGKPSSPVPPPIFGSSQLHFHFRKLWYTVAMPRILCCFDRCKVMRFSCS